MSNIAHRAVAALAAALFAAMPLPAWSRQDSGMELFPGAASTRPYSEAARVGGILVLSGQIGAPPGGKMPAAFDDQAKQTMENIAAALAARGLGMGSIFKCTVMLADIADYAAFNRVYVNYFKEGRFPTRSAFAVAQLPLDAKVEVECWAYAGTR